LTVTFELGRDFYTVHVIAKFNRPTFNRSEVGSHRVDKQTDKLTNKQTDAAENIQLDPLCYADG